jgi:hypothetical protein
VSTKLADRIENYDEDDEIIDWCCWAYKGLDLDWYWWRWRWG